jgi:membrane-bound lytic murein transglycosylase B
MGLVGLLGIAAAGLVASDPERDPARGPAVASVAAERERLGERDQSDLPVEAPDLPPPLTTYEAASVDPLWVTRVSKLSGISERALAAYAGSALRLSREQPTCGLGWNTLAGIGFVESEHGTIDGAQLGSDGVVLPAIVGIALDGTVTESIADTDAGVLDGDAVWDRAVGPMQFIPSTWSLWSSDGDGDGRADPQDIDDAVYSAGRYLCATGGDLREPNNWITAVASYNDTVDYNHRVADAADHFAVRAG